VKDLEYNALFRFLADLRFSGKAENTIQTYKLQLSRYLAFLSEKKIDIREVTNKELKDFRNWLSRECLSPATINLALSSVRALYEFLLFEGEVSGNPVSKRLNVKEAVRLPAFLEKQEEERALSWLRHNTPAHVALAFETMRATGIRVSEAAALTGADVKRIEGKVFLRVRCGNGGTANRVCGKGKKERYVPVLSGETAMKLNDKALERPSEPLFGVQASTLKWYAHQCKKATGVDFHSHRLRHTVGTTLLAEGVPLDVIQQLLGHASIATTRLYAATMPEKLMALAADIGTIQR
jgi:site-specific recombinase XerD